MKTFHFEKTGVVHKYPRTFIPPLILENLARAERIDEDAQKAARVTIQQSKISRGKRAKGPKDIFQYLGRAAAENAGRKIYDSNHTFEQQVEPVKRGEGGPITDDPAINQSYDSIGHIRDYLKNKLDRNSLDNNYMDLICNVHFGEKYNNAFWDGDEITLGDGDGKIFVSFAKSLDVIAHELGHGVVQFTANFEYENQPGALHEHFADVFGSTITQYVEGQTADDADWLIGDEIMGPDLYGECLRSMCEPGTAYDNDLLGRDPQPAHMKDYYSGSDDNGGVHINSGIPNKAFCLASKAIGTDNAMLIWYNGLQNLWPTANFNDAVTQIVRAARILTMNNKVKLGSAQKVRAAFKAVGLPT